MAIFKILAFSSMMMYNIYIIIVHTSWIIMTDMQPKKMIILDILDILRKHTDEDHRLSQQQIQNLMESEYGMKVDRKTVRRNLSKLIEFGFPIKYRGCDFENDVIVRNSKNGEEAILTDWYYVHEFMNGELRLLIDSVLLTDGLSKNDVV